MLDIIEVMENYVIKIRPPEKIRHKLDINYKIEGQNVILFEIRPMFKHPELTTESAYAKATYLKNKNKWNIYWMRSNLKWESYDPCPQVGTLREYVELVEEDAMHCFKG